LRLKIFGIPRADVRRVRETLKKRDPVAILIDLEPVVQDAVTFRVHDVTAPIEESPEMVRWNEYAIRKEIRAEIVRQLVPVVIEVLEW
jgi:hypothetical protein